ncbi:hypothetical protein Bca101_058989 [Brassica carinata]
MDHDDQDPRGYQLPRFLQDIVGNTYICHLKLNEFNFLANHKSFTVARIFTHNERIPGPALAPNTDDDMDGAKCVSTKSHVGGSSTNSGPKNGDEANDPSDAEETMSNVETENSLIENVAGVDNVTLGRNPAKKLKIA